MTMADAFDARLKAAFARAEPEPDEAFAAKVERKLAGGARGRAVMLGGAGACGSAVASTQLEDFFADVAVSPDAVAWMGDAAVILTYVQPQMLAAAALAVMLAGFAFILPSRS